MTGERDETIWLTVNEVRYGCGAGQGARCCRFILLIPNDPKEAHPGQFYCGRHTGAHDQLVKASGYMAQRMPIEPYPACHLRPVEK